MGWAVGLQFPTGSVMGFFFSSPPQPHRFWGPPSLLSSGYRGGAPFPRGKAMGAWGLPPTSI